MKQTHLLRNSYRFLIDLVYPNRCPCCNQVIAWDAWICEACQIETALNPDTVCSGCRKFKLCELHGNSIRGTNPAETGLDDGGCHCSSTDAAASVDFTGKESGGTHCKCNFFCHKDSGSYGFALEKAGRNSAAYVECRTAAYQCFAICISWEIIERLYFHFM